MPCLSLSTIASSICVSAVTAPPRNSWQYSGRRSLETTQQTAVGNGWYILDLRRTLPETKIAHEKCWLGSTTFLWQGLFSRVMLVLGEGTPPPRMPVAAPILQIDQGNTHGVSLFAGKVLRIKGWDLSKNKASIHDTCCFYVYRWCCFFSDFGCWNKTVSTWTLNTQTCWNHPTKKKHQNTSDNIGLPGPLPLKWSPSHAWKMTSPWSA